MLVDTKQRRREGIHNKSTMQMVDMESLIDGWVKDILVVCVKMSKVGEVRGYQGE